jgi:hypothetical protein
MSNEIPKTEQDFVGVDLHIHTPASNCYKGPKTDEEYLNIIRQYYEKNIKMIAITDHNTIKGYKKLISIKTQLESKVEALRDLVPKYPQLADEVETILRDLEIFKNLVILPGVEYEAKPGIHIVLIFSNTVDVKLIDDFLEGTGYPTEIQGKEEPSTISDIDVLDLLRRANDMGALTIAAHVDSNKGAYNSLSGSYRAAVIKSNYLHGVSYNNQKTKDKLLSLLQNKEYKRDEPLAFIQASDYHGEEECIGKNITYVRLKQFNFRGLLVAFKNPNESVSATERPEIINILNQILASPNNTSFEDFDEKEEGVNIVNAVTATLNQGFGSIVIGVVPGFNNIIGVSHDEEEIIKLLTSIFDKIQPGFPCYKNKVEKYPFGDKNIVVINLSSKGHSIFCNRETNKSYVIENGKIVKANPVVIARRVESRLVSKFEQYELENNAKLDELIQSIKYIGNSFMQFKLKLQIEDTSVHIIDVVETNVVDTYRGNEEFEFSGLGTSEGDTFLCFKTEARLPYAHLRCSPVSTADPTLNKMVESRFTGSALLITPGGGSHFVDRDDEWGVVALSTTGPVIVVKIKASVSKKLSEKLLIGWFKSSLFIWYTSCVLGNANIHDPNIFKNLLMPNSKLINKSETVEAAISSILSQEKDFIDTYNACDDTDEQIELIDAYNSNINKYYDMIDDIVYNCYSVSKEDTDIIDDMLKFNKIYTSNTMVNV